MKKLIIILIVLCAFACKDNSGVAVDYSFLPENKANKVVLDLSHLFNSIEIDSLSSKIIDFEKNTTNEIAILTIDSIKPFENIRIYSSAIGDYWKIGKKDKDNGLLITIVKNQRMIWLSTGDGTTKVLTDSICQEIIDNTIIPHFKNNNYYQGVNRGLDSLIRKWD